MSATPALARRPPRTDLMLAPEPGRTVEVFGEALGLPGQMLVTICVEAASRLARCPRTGRALAVVQPDDMLLVTRGGVAHLVAAGWSSLTHADAQLLLVGAPLASI